MADEIEKWRKVWRVGFAPMIATETLEKLLVAAESDDQHLTQGSTTTPPPLMWVQDWPVEAACALGFCGAVENGGFTDQSKEPATVGQCEEAFAKLCFDADMKLGEPAACRWWLNWFDDTDRPTMLRELAAEVRLALASRQEGEQPIIVGA